MQKAVRDMRGSIRLAFAYLRYYKKQTLALFLGIVLSASMLTGIGSLIGSGRSAVLENVREKYGDWHYSTRCDFPWYSDFVQNKSGKGYDVEKAGVLTIRKVLEEPYEIVIAYADPVYMEMMERKLVEGKYPQQKNEVAMDTFTLKNLSFDASVGSHIVLDGEEFVLSGIVSDMEEAENMQVFVNETVDYGKNGKFLYLKFNESEKVDRQAKAFVETFGIEHKTLYRNNNITSYVGGESFTNLLEVIKTSVSVEGAGFPYMWSVLNKSWNLTERAVLAALGLFGVFIIYSLFQVSIMKRMSQYSMMQAVGMSDRATFAVLAAELGIIFVVGYPVGCVLGNIAAALIYQKNGEIFIQPEEYIVHSGVEKAQVMAAANLPDPGKFHLSGSVIRGGAVFFFLLILVIAWMLLRRMRKMTTRELMAKESGKKRKNRTIYSLKGRGEGSVQSRRGAGKETKVQSSSASGRGPKAGVARDLTRILTKKFMLERKGAFLGILLSLSVGSLIFLGTAYVTKNTKINNELTFKADDGLGSDIQIYEDSDSLTDVIPKDTAEQLKQISELEQVNPVRYMLGEIALMDGKLTWNNFYPEIDTEVEREPDPVLMEKYNGIATQVGDDDYKLKVNIYGYDDMMLNALDEYLLEGEIDPERMREENTVIFKTLMGGQGTYEGIDILTGDNIQLKTPVNAEVSEEVLRFLSAEEEYIETEFKVAALVSRPLAKVDTFIEDNGTDRVDIIMTNEQMKENFGVEGYQTISINLAEGADASKAGDKIHKVVSGVSKCVVKDYTQQIERQNLFLKQKMMFFYGVAFILLMISLLHVMNSMQYLVVARKHEFGILRAMGITDAGFRKMLLKEGLRYGIYSSAVMIVLYLVLQKFLYYFVIHVYLYLHPVTSLPIWGILLMAGVNILICITAVLVSGQSVLKQQIVEAIQE